MILKFWHKSKKHKITSIKSYKSITYRLSIFILRPKILVKTHINTIFCKNSIYLWALFSDIILNAFSYLPKSS